MQENHFAETHTRYVATLGPASGNYETMEKLVQAGVSMFRNNFAHTQYDEYRDRLRFLKEINAKHGTSVKMDADIQGTNIRLGILPGDGKMELRAGETYVCVTNGGEVHEGEIPVNDTLLQNEVKIGEPFIFADGAVDSIITALDGNRITVQVKNTGMIKSRKSINVPDTNFQRGCVTDKDREVLNFLINESEVDWIALSFVGCKEDVFEVRNLIGDKNIKIMAKIERKKAMDNLIEITNAVDALMIARGDLGIEIPMEEVPVASKRMIRVAHEFNKPALMATQMMLSMTQSLRPTRAEVSDVANAVYDGADGLMLSEETAEGAHPEHVLATMVKIAKHIEEDMYPKDSLFGQY